MADFDIEEGQELEVSEVTFFLQYTLTTNTHTHTNLFCVCTETDRERAW